jgi:hypothetical protein
MYLNLNNTATFHCCLAVVISDQGSWKYGLKEWGDGDKIISRTLK